MTATENTTLLLSDVTAPDGRRVDIRIDDGRIAAIEPHSPGAGPVPAGPVIDGGGELVLPAFVDGHCHLDKTLIGAPWQEHSPSGSLRDRIAAEKRLRSRIEVPVTERATALAEQMIALGTGYVRSHVDVDPETGLDGLRALLQVRETLAGRLGMQLVAFPQSGVVTAPGVAGLLEAALAEGAEVIGGLDPAGFDGDVDGQLDVVFGLADRHGAGIDIHLHDGGAAGLAQLSAVAERTRVLGLRGRVTVSHAYVLGQADADDLDAVARALAGAGVAIMTNGPAGTMPPVLRLREHGVRVFAGSDNIRDAWWPYGTGDMLERATIIGLQGGLRTDGELRYAASLVTESAAAVLGLADYGLRVGARADLVVVAARSVPEAVAAHPPRRLVLHGGRVVSGG